MPEDTEVRFQAVKTDKDGNVIGYASEKEMKDAIQDAQKPKEKVIKPLANKNAVKKKSFGKRMKEAIFGDDVEHVGSYVFYDILIPAFKKLLSDMAKGAVDMALYGDSRVRARDSGRTHVSMSSVYEGRSEGRSERNRSRGRNKLNDILFDSRADAEYVLEQLVDLVDEYGNASLQDLYSLVGFDSAHTDANWGWTNLRGSAVVAVSDGYILDLPPIKALV